MGTAETDFALQLEGFAPAMGVVAFDPRGYGKSLGGKACPVAVWKIHYSWEDGDGISLQHDAVISCSGGTGHEVVQL
eukprot:Skav225049  [mRNA]  locus=scaffold1570:67489:67719:- [translate_table: standard]